MRVGGEQQKPGAGLIEPSDRDQRVGLISEYVENGAPAFRIAPSCDHSARFVERDGSPGNGTGPFASGFDRHGFGRDQRRGIANDPATNADVASLDRTPCFGARREAELGERAVEPDGHPPSVSTSKSQLPTPDVQSPAGPSRVPSPRLRQGSGEQAEPRAPVSPNFPTATSV